MHDLALAENIPRTLVVETHDLVENFRKSLLPYTINDYDVREIINQITDTIVSDDKNRSLEKMRALPLLDRIVSRHFLESIERQHLLKAATFELGWKLYDRLTQLGVFKSLRFKGKFPYALFEMQCGDAFFTHIPY
jgi:hypothetical protein